MDAEKQNAASGAYVASDGSAVVEVIGTGEDRRVRIHVELKPGETTVVSYRKMCQLVNMEVSSPDSSSDSDPMPFTVAPRAPRADNVKEGYIQVERSSIKGSRSIVNRNKVHRKTGRNESSKLSTDRTKKRRKEIVDFAGEKDDVRVHTKRMKKGNQLVKAAKETASSVDPNSTSPVFNVQSDHHSGELHNPINPSIGVPLKKHSDSGSILDCLPYAKKLHGDASGFPAESLHNDKMGFTTDYRDPGKSSISSITSDSLQKYQEKKSAPHDSQSMSSMSKQYEQQGFTNMKQRNKKGRNELPDLNLPYTGHAPRTASMHITEAPKSREKMLDRAIIRLEKFVENSKTPLVDVQRADASWLATEKRLPPELKEKLANIARLTQLNEGKIAEELIDRLMGIVGIYFRRKTLKKIMRETVLQDLFASQEGGEEFKQIKKEIVEMISLRAPSLKNKEFPASKVSGGFYSMDNQLEDKLYDLYDSFAQGLDEDIGPSLVRRLYVQLSELWPKGTMDNHGIQKAICRASERKRVLGCEEKGHEMTKKRKLSAARTGESVHGKAYSLTQTPAEYRNVITDTSRPAQTVPNRIVPKMATIDLDLAATPSRMSPIQSKSSYLNMERSDKTWR